MPICQARFTSCHAAICLTVAAVFCGCSRAPDPNRFIPASEPARAALEAVLVDWQAGLPRGRIDRLPVKVEPIDNQRKKGQELARFEIMGEVPHAGARCFAVRLKYSNSAVDEKVRFVVLGIDPLYVYRQEDFDLLNQWDHMMPSEPHEDVTATGVESSDDRNLVVPDESIAADGSIDRPDPTPDQPAQPESRDK